MLRLRLARLPALGRMQDGVDLEAAVVERSPHGSKGVIREDSYSPIAEHGWVRRRGRRPVARREKNEEG